MENIYRALVAEERRHSRVSDAIDASGAPLAATLAQHGVTYDEFVWSLAGAVA